MISVLVPALNEEKYIENCLKSIQSQSCSEPYEVVVMDNGSEDDTRDIAEEFADRVIVEPDLELYELRNKGIEVANGEKIAMTDADCVVEKGWLGEARKGLSKADLVTGAIEPLEDSKFYRFSLWLFYDLFLTCSVNYFGFSNAIGGNCAFYRKKAIDIGGFKDIFPSDGNFGYEMSKEGEIFHNPNMVIETSVRHFWDDSIFEIVKESALSHIRLRRGVGKSVEESGYLDYER